MDFPIIPMPDTSGFRIKKVQIAKKPPIQSKCANGCGQILEGLLVGGTCCSKACADELIANIEADKAWEYMNDYALEMEGKPLNNEDDES